MNRCYPQRVLLTRGFYDVFATMFEEKLLYDVQVAHLLQIYFIGISHINKITTHLEDT